MVIRDERALEIAREMVSIPSVNTTEGERHIGEYLENLLREMPYFKEHPEQLSVSELQNDALHRRNVMALLIGEKDRRPETMVWHGHTDTVGVEDYGPLNEAAFQPDALKEILLHMELPEEVKKDLESGDYMFGRGACDMKSGDAVFLSLFEWLSQHPEKLSGNILLSLNPVEENLHTGILEGIDTLLLWREKFHLRYEMAINNDYTCPLYPGDEKITMYTGVVGKLLPCFYIQGKETHVGQCFEGMDAAYIAAKLVEKIHLNMDFSDCYDGEASMPPSVLKMKDLKPWYNVQTTKEALVYFNYFVHNAEMDEITSLLTRAAESAMEEAAIKVRKESERYLGNGFLEKKPIRQETTARKNEKDVLLYEELVGLVQKHTGMNVADIREIENQFCRKERERGTDLREIPVALIKHFIGMIQMTHPVIVLYFAPPYCPHNMLQKESKALEDDLRQIADEMKEKTGTTYRMMHFFPSLSDSSYLKIDDSDASIEKLKQNFPMMDLLYPLPLDKIRQLDIPSVDFGCYGKDAHKWTERVYIPYTFSVLPELIRTTLTHFGYLPS